MQMLCILDIPVTESNLYAHLDIPEIFLNDRRMSPRFSSLIENMTKFDEYDRNFKVEHLIPFLEIQYVHFLTDLYINYLFLVTKNSLLRTSSGKDSVRHGLLAVNFLMWNYTPYNVEESIRNGEVHLEEFYQAKYYESLSLQESFVWQWLREFVKKERILGIMRAMREPFDIVADDNEDKEVINILRDAKKHGPFVLMNLPYQMSYSINVRDFFRYIEGNIQLANLMLYRISSYDEMRSKTERYVENVMSNPDLLYSDYTKRWFSARIGSSDSDYRIVSQDLYCHMDQYDNSFVNRNFLDVLEVFQNTNQNMLPPVLCSNGGII